MALATAEARAHSPQVWDESLYTNYGYRNYAVPNLAPRAFEPGGAPRARQMSWRDAPPPPPDPVRTALQWMMQHPGFALLLAYAAWLGCWSLYAMQTLSEF
jgi:hypothetical protein